MLSQNVTFYDHFLETKWQEHGYPKNLNQGELHFYFLPTSKVKIILFLPETLRRVRQSSNQIGIVIF